MKTVFGGVDEVTHFLDEMGVKKPLVLRSSDRLMSWLIPALEGREAAHFDGARQHVPKEVVEEALLSRRALMLSSLSEVGCDRTR